MKNLFHYYFQKLMETGWIEVQNNTYTSGSPFSLSADSDTILPIWANAENDIVRETQRPPDIAEGGMFDISTQKITGRNGDGLNIFIYCLAQTANSAGAYLDLWVDIGSPVGELYRRTITFPKGNNTPVGLSASFAAFTLNTWETNGGILYVRSNVACSLYNIRLVLTRTHKAR